MAFIAVITLSVTKVQLRVFGPLVGFGQQHAVGVMGVDLGADLLEDVVSFRQVFVVGAVPFDQVGNGVQAQAVDAQVEPIAHHRQHRFHDLRVIKVEVGLVRVKAVPEVLAGHRVPGPVGLFGVEENNACAVVFLVIIRPHVEVPCGRAWLGLARALEPGVLVGGVVDHQFSDHAQPALVGLGNKALGVGHRPVVAVHAAVFGNVVAVITPGRWVERQQPDGVHAEVGNVVELGDQPGKVTNAVVVGVEIGFDVNLVDYRVFVPERVFDKGGCLGFLGHCKLLKIQSSRGSFPRSA